MDSEFIPVMIDSTFPGKAKLISLTRLFARGNVHNRLRLVYEQPLLNHAEVISNGLRSPTSCGAVADRRLAVGGWCRMKIHKLPYYCFEIYHI